MTPQQLDAEMKAAQLDQFGPDPGRATYPSKFFDQNVQVYKGDPDGNEVGGTRTQVNPAYCASDYGAKAIGEILGAVGSVNLCPLNPDGLQFGWATTKNTPYLQFKDGIAAATINAGYLLSCFAHGYPPDLALHLCQLEIEGDMQ